MQLLVMLETMQCVLACLLVAFFLGVAFPPRTFMAVDDNLCVEEGRAVFVFGFCKQDIFKGDFMLLAPLQEFALEVHLLVCHLVYVNETTQYLLLHEALAMAVTSVEIDGTDECFESIAGKIAVVCLIVFVAADELVETNLRCKFAECLPLDYLASGICQEAFSLAGEVMIDYLAYDSSQNGIAEKLQSLVVETVSFFAMGEHRLVHQCFLIEADVMRIEAQHIMKSAIKFLILTERQPYRVYQV